jgi:phosphate transport system substrate-binding protein
LLILLLSGGGYWFFTQRNTRPTATNQAPATSITNQTPNSAINPAAGIVDPKQFPSPQTVSAGTTITIEGSTSMVTLNQNLKMSFETQFPGTIVTTQANGSTKGIEALLNRQADLAAISRPLSPAEVSQGLRAVPIAQDQIAIIIGVNNPLSQTLSPEQVKGIFQGKITNWSEVGGVNKPIRVINRPAISGTHNGFKELVLGGENFGTTPNITTLNQDATTPLLRSLQDDGIGYATATQVLNQSTVRVVAINGLTPAAQQYPYTRTLYYAYRDPASPAAAALLGYVLSPSGQQALFAGS